MKKKPGKNVFDDELKVLALTVWKLSNNTKKYLSSFPFLGDPRPPKLLEVFRLTTGNANLI